MEMEFKDNSRRRTLVLVIGVLLALGAGAAAFMLSSQSTEEPVATIPLRQVVVAADNIPAREVITQDQLDIREVPLDDTNALTYSDPTEVAGNVAAIPISAGQAISPNMLARATGVGQVNILKPNETVEVDSPYWRAVSLIVPPDRAVGGLIAEDQRVDVIASMTWQLADDLVDPETGEPVVDPETGEPVAYVPGTSTKLMWTDTEVIGRPEGNAELYILRMDLQQAEEVAMAQAAGAQFSMVLRPEVDTRDIDRSSYGETQDRLMTRYNFPLPEAVDALEYPQPVPFPSPFPAEPYLEITLEPSPSPEAALIDIPVDEPLTASPAPEESPAP